jgi:iron complex outermembrane receptor protein
MKSLPYRSIAAAFAALLASQLPAQTAAAPTADGSKPATEPAIELSVFEVTTSRDIGYQSTNAAEVTRMNTPIENIPMNVTIFNEQFINDLLATDTAELLAYEATVVKTSENDNFLARGSTSVGTNFLNGFAQTIGHGSQPLSNVDRVEVLRGPAAVLFGSGGYGGTINRITKQPQPKPFFNTRAIVRGNESYRAEFDYNGGHIPHTNQKLLFRVNGAIERSNTWFDQRKKEDSLAPSLTWAIGPKTKLVLEYLYNWRETQGSWETPVRAGDPIGTVTGDGVYRITPRQIAWVSPEDYRYNTRQVASYNLQHAFTRNLQFRSQFQWEDKVQEFLELQAVSDTLMIIKDAVLIPRVQRFWPRWISNYRMRNELVWEVSTGPINHRLLFGQGFTEQYDLRQTFQSPRNHGGITNATFLNGPGRLTNAQAGPIFNFFPNVSYAELLANPQVVGLNLNNYMPINMTDRSAEGPSFLGARPTLYPDVHTDTYSGNHDFYINDVFSFAKDRVYIMAGLRYSENEQRIQTFTSGTFPNKVMLSSPPTVKRSADATTHSFGGVFHLNKAHTLSLYGNLANSFTPEFNVQPDGTPLDPQTGEQKEVGVRFSFMGGRFTGLATWFDLIQDNVTEADPNQPAGWFRQRNGDHSSGLELSLNSRFTENWLVFGGYAYTDARNEKTGLGTPLQPNHRFTMFNRYNFNEGVLKGLGLSLGTIYTGERIITPTTLRNEPNWGPLPAYWRIDAIVSYKWRPKNSKFRYDASFKVTNLTDDQEIYYVAQNHRYTIDPGREWQFVIGMKF